MTVRIEPLSAPRRHPHVTVFVFPHAGGSPRFFTPLIPGLAVEFTLSGITYPGRDALMDVAHPADIPELARACAHAIAPVHRLGPVVLLGHSLGSYVAFETARIMEQHGPAPDALVVSGADAPSLGAPGDWRSASDAELARHVGAFDARTRAALDRPELARLALPTLRADYHLIENYSAAPDHTVGCPVTVVRATGDPEVTEAGTRAWRDHARSGFRVRTLDGGHFTFVTDPGVFDRTLRACLYGAAVAQSSTTSAPGGSS